MTIATIATMPLECNICHMKTQEFWYCLLDRQGGCHMRLCIRCAFDCFKPGLITKPLAVK
jgi:hypothetical protein